MDKLFILQFAFRNLFSHRMRTYLTLIGIMIGISAIVFLISFAFGIEKLVTSEITGGDAFKLIDVGTGNSQLVKLNRDAVKSINDLAYSESVETTMNLAGKVKEGDRAMDVAFFAASSKYVEWSGYKPKTGKMYQDSDRDTIVVNTAYLNFLGIKEPEEAISKKVKLDIVIPKELMDKEESYTVLDQEFEIVGVVENGASPNIFSSQEKILPYVKNFSQAKVEIKVRDQVPDLRKRIEAMGFKTQYVGDTVSQIEEIFNVFKLILGSFGLIALVVASLGMFNTLTISLLERMREVALLKILGAQRKDVSILFMVEALIFGGIGGVLGILLGVLTGQVFNIFLNIYAVQSGGDPAKIFYYPAWFILAVMVFSLMVGFLTGIYPSRRAARVKSLDVIRYE